MDIEKGSTASADISQAFYRSALAFLDAAEYLATSMRQQRFTEDVNHGAAAVWLAFHATELLCKACLSKLAPSSSVNGHSLGELLQRLQSLRSGFRFDVPFDVEFAPATSGSTEARKNQDRILHERFRYPIDKSGQAWAGVRAFSAEMFEGDLAGLRQEFTRIHSEVLV